MISIYNRSNCFVCDSKNLRLLLSLEIDGIPHGNSGHGHVYNCKSILLCDSCAHAQLECYSHDCFSHYEDEDWDMWWWYILDKASTVELIQLISNCPNPLNSGCDCSMHVSLRDSSQGLWGGIKSAIYPNDNVEAASIKLEINSGKPLFVCLR
jgi:hypothetical protein